MPASTLTYPVKREIAHLPLNERQRIIDISDDHEVKAAEKALYAASKAAETWKDQGELSLACEAQVQARYRLIAAVLAAAGRE